MIDPVRLQLITLLLGMPLLAMVRLRRPSDMGSSATVVPGLLILLFFALQTWRPNT